MGKDVLLIVVVRDQELANKKVKMLNKYITF